MRVKQGRISIQPAKRGVSAASRDRRYRLLPRADSRSALVVRARRHTSHAVATGAVREAREGDADWLPIPTVPEIKPVSPVEPRISVILGWQLRLLGRDEAFRGRRFGRVITGRSAGPSHQHTSKNNERQRIPFFRFKGSRNKVRSRIKKQVCSLRLCGAFTRMSSSLLFFTVRKREAERRVEV